MSSRSDLTTLGGVLASASGLKPGNDITAPAPKATAATAGMILLINMIEPKPCLASAPSHGGLAPLCGLVVPAPQKVQIPREFGCERGRPKTWNLRPGGRRVRPQSCRAQRSFRA